MVLPNLLDMRLRLAGWGVAVMLLAGCAGPGVKEVTTAPGELPPSAQVAAVPFFAQEENYCGPAAVAMTLSWSGLDVSPEDIVRNVYTPAREGTLKFDILGAARRNGRLAVRIARLRDVLREIAGGHPVLVFQNLGLEMAPQWHFAVATGYDLKQNEIILHSGTERDLRMSLNTFAHTWARGGNWAVTITPPDQLPASAEEAPTLRAAIGLERAGHASAAARAYNAILDRWPQSFGASIGLGNARYSLARYDGAAEAFMRATALRPDSAAAWNNLAHAMAALGRREKAVEAAQRAVELGGKSTPTYRATLVEVSAIPQ